MNPDKVLWEEGDFTEIAAIMQGIGSYLRPEGLTCASDLVMYPVCKTKGALTPLIA
jgi:hypothetical protein